MTAIPPPRSPDGSLKAPLGSAALATTMGRSMGLFNKILHAGEGKKLKSLESIVPAVGAFEPEMQRRSDDELRALTASFRERLAQVPDQDTQLDLLDDLLPEAFAVAREAVELQRGLGPEAGQ